MDYIALKTELDAGHPVTGAYNASDAIAETEINAVNVSTPRTTMNGDEIFAATINSEFVALTDHKRELWVSFTSKDIINAYATVNIEFVDFIFGPASATKAALASIRTELLSRVQITGLGKTTAEHIRHANSNYWYCDSC